MRQYLEIKDSHPDCIVFFRLGDFYEMFFDDAVVAARVLDLTLTSRDKGKDNPVPMCGVPHHAAKHYIGKLVAAGMKVAICEQMEDPKQARGIVRREVVRVVTPGVVLEEEHLEAKAAHYLVAAVVAGERAGVAHLDVTTGEFGATELAAAELVDELARLEPRELLAVGFDPEGLRGRVRAAFSSPSPGAPRDGAAARAALEEVLGRGLDPALSPLALIAGAHVVRYAKETQPHGALPLVTLRPYRPADHLILDEATRANLELFCTIQGQKREGALLAVLDETRTAMGGRLLRRWLAAPLCEVAQIRRRHDAVGWLVEEAALRGELRGELGEIYDLERLCGRVTLGVATPRDLAALARSLERLPELARRLDASFAASKGRLSHPELLELGEDLLGDVAAQVKRVLVDEPPAQWREGGFCRRGFSAELDELSDLAQGGKEHVAAIEEREREKTGIGSLKVRYNRVFGYYLEVTRANLDKVPAEYVRKQTTANAERFVTAELAEYEQKILSADERRLALELAAFEKLRVEVGRAAPRLLQVAERVARLDALAGLAEVAHASGYCRPEVDDGLVLELVDARHPVVEKLAAEGRFVPNDLALDPDGAQVVILTGPNMAGKSTAMRQAALIVVMAQMGSFVPAGRAGLGVVDRVFTRVGASDNLARGDSTFMVEMRETAHILLHATRRSLVVLDEIGRGTATYDGMALAWAVVEHLHDRIGCKTLFATHYHELCALERSHPRVRNYSTAVREYKDEIVFLHKVVPGGASRSYGIQVARLAGLDKRVIARAREIVDRLERGEPASGVAAESPQLSLLGPPAAPPAAESEVERLLAAIDLDGVTPREALALLFDLKARLRS